jgi:hypothetical protein
MNQVSFEQADSGILLLRFAGSWRLSGGLAALLAFEREIPELPSVAGLGEVVDVDIGARLMVVDALDRRTAVPYDNLIVAAGASPARR